MKAKTPPPKSTPRPFLRRIGVIVAVVALFAGLIATAVFVFNRAIPRPAALVVPGPLSLPNLPGLRSQLSDRSKVQLQTIAQANEHVVAIVAIKYKYDKNESPFLYAWSRPKGKAMIDKIVADTASRQLSKKAMSSDEARVFAMRDPKTASVALRNSEEAKLGLVKCVAIDEVSLTNPELKSIATGVCYATIPPFDPNTAIAILVLTDSDLAQYGEVTEMRRMLLMLQIDIFNRDFQGRETWVHP